MLQYSFMMCLTGRTQYQDKRIMKEEGPNVQGYCTFTMENVMYYNILQLGMSFLGLVVFVNNDNIASDNMVRNGRLSMLSGKQWLLSLQSSLASGRQSLQIQVSVH